jgi:hypothetical protein
MDVDRDERAQRLTLQGGELPTHTHTPIKERLGHLLTQVSKRSCVSAAGGNPRVGYPAARVDTPASTRGGVI